MRPFPPRCGCRPAPWLGSIAYSLYLWHASLGLVAAPLAAAWGITHPRIVLLLKFALAISISALLYVLVERPAMRARDWQWRALPLKGGFARWGGQRPMQWTTARAVPDKA